MSVTIRINNDPNPDNELNITNRNFATLWAALGLDHQWTGQIDARLVAQRCQSTPPELVMRESRMDNSHCVCVYDCGISYEQASRYLARLGLLARVAARREEPLVWY